MNLLEEMADPANYNNEEETTNARAAFAAMVNFMTPVAPGECFDICICNS